MSKESTNAEYLAQHMSAEYRDKAQLIAYMQEQEERQYRFMAGLDREYSSGN